MSSLCIEHSILPCTKSKINTLTRLLELLHMDLMGSKVGKSIERTKFIYAEAMRMICLYLEQLPIRTLINPYEIKRRIIVQIRYRGIHPIRETCPEKTVIEKESPYEKTPYFSSRGLRNFFISSASQKESKEDRMKGHNASISERSRIASIEVRTRLRT